MTRFFIHLTFTISLAMFAFAARAQTSTLRLEGDLLIHPDQIGDFFERAARKISSTTVWDWPELKFTKPYKTSWSNVQARGPFAISFATANLARQEIGFELSWSEPTVQVGRFEINDTITRKSGTNTVIVRLEGSCDGMSVRFPAGDWRVRGSLKWASGPQGLQVAWEDFQFSGGELSVATVDLGHCEGPHILGEALRDTIMKVGRDREWMEEVLRDGVLNWIEGTLGGLQDELLKPREVSVRAGLALAWNPLTVVDGGAGVIRVGGQVVVAHAASRDEETVVPRGYDPNALTIRESGFVLPKSTLPEILKFLQRHGELGFRARSTDIPAFQSLMQSRLAQFFVWPDLMGFSKSTQFYFDVSSTAAPNLTGGYTVTGGVVYQAEAPLVVHQWAPSATAYVPYLDFNASLKGQLLTRVRQNKLVLEMRPEPLGLGATFRAEFQRQVRAVTSRISKSILSSRITEYLEGKTFEFDLPRWELSQGFSLGVKDLKLTEKTLRIPLELKSGG